MKPQAVKLQPTFLADEKRRKQEASLVKEQIALIEKSTIKKPVTLKYMVANMFAVSIDATNYDGNVPELLPHDEADAHDLSVLWDEVVSEKLSTFCSEDGKLNRSRLSYMLSQIYEHFIPGLMYDIRLPRMQDAMKKGY